MHMDNNYVLKYKWIFKWNLHESSPLFSLLFKKVLLTEEDIATNINTTINALLLLYLRHNYDNKNKSIVQIFEELFAQIFS